MKLGVPSETRLASGFAGDAGAEAPAARPQRDWAPPGPGRRGRAVGRRGMGVERGRTAGSRRRPRQRGLLLSFSLQRWSCWEFLAEGGGR
jgi:hypothetical protein